jgi:sec-independent protein translocase protein TatA
MFGDFGAPELLIVLVIVVLLFGPGRLSKIMGELGKGLRSFKESMSSEEEKKPDSIADENVTPK